MVPHFLLAVVLGVLACATASFPVRTRKLASAETADGDVLCDLYNTLPSPVTKGKLTNWCGAKAASGVDYVNGPCTGASAWNGVSCTGGRVTKVSLSGGVLVGGSIPSSIGGLDALSWLDLEAVSLSGSLPRQLGSLTNMQYMVLNGNSLSGTIPSSLGGLTGLKALYLHANALTGSIHSALGVLAQLIALGINSNALTGPVPASFCSLQSSIQLQVQNNAGLTCYPWCLSAYVSYTKDLTLSVCTTAETGDGDALCALYNTMPTASKTKLTNWCGVKKEADYVNGPCTGASAWNGVTCTSGRVTKLDFLNAIPQISGVGGSLPTSIGGLAGLSWLDLGGNSIAASVPVQLGLLTNLAYVSLASNALTGRLPVSFCSGIKSTAALNFQANPGLSCYPSCLAAYSSFSKDSSLAACATGTALSFGVALTFSGLTAAIVERDTTGSIASNLASAIASALGLSSQVASGSASLGAPTWSFSSAAQHERHALLRSAGRRLSAQASASVVVQALPSDVASASQVQSKLAAASGDILSQVQASAAVKNSGSTVGFVGVTATAIMLPTAAPVATPQQASNADVTGTIVGAVVGVVGGLLLLGGAYYYFVIVRVREEDGDGSHAYSSPGGTLAVVDPRGGSKLDDIYVGQNESVVGQMPYMAPLGARKGKGRAPPPLPTGNRGLSVDDVEPEPAPVSAWKWGWSVD